MSVIVIKHPYEGLDMCSVCLQIQLRSFRNKIKERWNRYNNDGKNTERVEIELELDPLYICEQACSTVNGSGVCLTHMFNGVNAAIEQEEMMAKAASTPKLVVAEGSLDGFKKGKGG